MKWSYRELMEAPAWFGDQALILMEAEAEVARRHGNT
jgi:hypothetical protein|tara:strand:- start:2099 stop:2209 length:111 start_codon:yes stop_codon:yes gene_type:complete